jgi:site-specific recombinase XerD
MAGVKEIQQRMGNTDINETTNIYTHMTSNMKKRPPTSSAN